MIITVGIAIGGFRTFGRWKRERIEERKIETAIRALAFVYESKFVFEGIRNEFSISYEWKNMPEFPGDTEQKRNARGPFYATLMRIKAHKEFFEQAWKIQAECSAIFGTEIEETFLLMHKARREIEVSAEMLWRDPNPTDRSEANLKTWNSFRADVWPAYGRFADDGDKVGKKLKEFREQMEKQCRPIVDKMH